MRRSSGASPTPHGSACSTACSTQSVSTGGTRHRRVATTRPLVSSDAPPLADIPCDSLGDGPVYRPPDGAARRSRCPTRRRSRAAAARRGSPTAPTSAPSCWRSSRSPTIADKSWVWRQYDHQLFLNTVVGPGADATVLRLKGTAAALALSTDGKARFCRLDPHTGGRLVVLEAARNVACAGADPRRARQLPQLRQPGAPRGDVAVRRGRRRDERGVPRAAASPSSAAT